MPCQDFEVKLVHLGVNRIMEDSRRQELTERFVAAAEYLNRQTHLHRLDEWETLDMTIPQLKTLVLLERKGALRMGSISMYLGRALSATTTVVDRLVEKKLVGRSSDPDDRRVVLCYLTDMGHDTVDRFWRIGNDRIKMVSDLMEPDQLEVVVRGLEFICTADQLAQKSLESTESKS